MYALAAALPFLSLPFTFRPVLATRFTFRLVDAFARRLPRRRPRARALLARTRLIVARAAAVWSLMPYWIAIDTSVLQLTGLDQFAQPGLALLRCALDVELYALRSRFGPSLAAPLGSPGHDAHAVTEALQINGELIHAELLAPLGNFETVSPFTLQSQFVRQAPECFWEKEGHDSHRCQVYTTPDCG